MIYTEQQRKGEMQWLENLKPADEYKLLRRAFNEHFSIYGDLLEEDCIRKLILTAFDGDNKLRHDLYVAFETGDEAVSESLLEQHSRIIEELCEVLDNIVDIITVAHQIELDSSERSAYIYALAQSQDIPLSHWDTKALAEFAVASLK